LPASFRTGMTIETAGNATLAGFSLMPFPLRGDAEGATFMGGASGGQPF
jgi:hypothetical protein